MDIVDKSVQHDGPALSPPVSAECSVLANAAQAKSEQDIASRMT